MTDKKDFTSIHDLGEFEHVEDSEIDAQLAEDLKSKTTITNLDDLDSDSNDTTDFESEDSSFDEFQYGETDNNQEEDDFSTTDITGEIETDSFNNDNDNLDNHDNDNETSLSDDASENFDLNSLPDDDDSASFTDNELDEYEANQTDNQDEHILEENLDFDSDENIENEFETIDENDQGNLNEDSQELETDNFSFSDEQESQETYENREQSSEDNEDNEYRDANSSDVVDELSVDRDLSQRYLDSQTTPSPIVNSMPSESIGIGSLQSEDIQGLSQERLNEVSESISDNVPEIPRISTTFDDFRQEVENLTYAPSPDGSGPLFGLKLTGELSDYQDHMQSLFDEYQIGVNLRESAYQGPMNAGLMQITRINEYIAIQLSLALAKYGIKTKVYFLEDLIQEDGLDKFETRGLESEYNLPQNRQDQAEFINNDWDENDILMTTTSGPKGYKVLKRCGVAQKIMTIDADDFEKLQTNIIDFFNDDIHLSGSSTLLDGVIKKTHEEIKEQARNQGANAIVNFKLEQRINPRIVSLHFTGDLLYLRKLK